MVTAMSFSLTTANITHGESFQPQSTTGLAENLEMLGTQLLSDIVCLQEVDSFHQRSHELEQTSIVQRSGNYLDAKFAAAMYGDPGPGREWRKSTVEDFESVEPVPGGYGIAILSKFPVRSWERHEMTGSKLSMPLPIRIGDRTVMVPIPDEPRVALAAEIETPLGLITVINTHLSFIPPTAMKQLAGLMKWARSLETEFVLAGDLNLSRRIVNRITGMNNAVDFKTYPAMSPRAHIDHVTYGDSLKTDHTHPRWLQAGDHLSVTTNFSRS
jgi:endonuclease/exonuclease/phosphatase family metal-dependent hydrolase